MRTFLNNNRPWIESAVPIDIAGRGVALTAYVCGTVERRLAYALGRFARRVQRVYVHLSDVHAPQGGERSCRIEMYVSWHAPIHVTASAERMERAITKAAHAAARRLDELFKRRRGA